MNRDELLAFARWLLNGEIGEGREEQLVDNYLAEQHGKPEPRWCSYCDGTGIVPQ